MQSFMFVAAFADYEQEVPRYQMRKQNSGYETNKTGKRPHKKMWGCFSVALASLVLT